MSGIGNFKNHGSVPGCEFEEIRLDEVEQIVQKLNPGGSSKRIENPHRYGKRGSGKSLVLSSVSSKLLEKRPGLCINNIDCRVHDTEYKVLREMVGHLGKRLPEFGYSSSQARNVFAEALPESEKCLMVLENVDLLLERDGDNLFYFLSRLERGEDLSRVGIVTASSLAPNLDDMLSPRVRGSYDYEKIALESLGKERVIRGLENCFDKYGVEREVVVAVVNLLA